MGTDVRPDRPGQGYRSDQHAGFEKRKRRSDGTFEPLICTCTVCGRIYEYLRSRGHSKLRCNSCKANTWASRPDWAQVKKDLVAVRGGKCHICGYSRHVGALGFHHLEPGTKSFNIAGAHTRRWDVLVHEARKCVLLCENCHREVHAGVAEIPPDVMVEIGEYIRDLPRRPVRPNGRARLDEGLTR